MIAVAVVVAVVVGLTRGHRVGPFDLPDPCASEAAAFSNAFSLQLFEQRIDVAYRITCGHSIAVNVTGQTNGRGWIAIGFNRFGLMPGADLWQIGEVDGRVVVRDGHSSSGRRVVTDRFVDNVTGFRIADGTISAAFERPLVGMTPDRDWTFGRNDPCFIIAASSEHASFDSKHQREAVSTDVVQLFQTDADSLQGLESYQHNIGATVSHGAMMLLAWVALMPAGTFIAAFLKSLGRPWFLLHVGMLGSVWALTFVGVLTIVFERHWRGNNHNRHPHSLLGLFVLFMVTGQAVLGIVSDRRWSSDRKSVPWHDKAHWWLGRLLGLVAPANCVLGIVLIADNRAQAGLWLFVAWVVVAVVVFGSGAVAFWRGKQADAARWRNVVVAFAGLGLVPAIVIPMVAQFEDRGRTLTGLPSL
jgi:hypothetical protein